MCRSQRRVCGRSASDTQGYPRSQARDQARSGRPTSTLGGNLGRRLRPEGPHRPAGLAATTVGRDRRGSVRRPDNHGHGIAVVRCATTKAGPACRSRSRTRQNGTLRTRRSSRNPAPPGEDGQSRAGLPLDVGDQGREHPVLLHDSGDLRRRRPERRHHRVDIGDVGRHGNQLAAVECRVVNDVRPTEPSDRLGPLRFEPQPL
jgi:hypothetical protein